jgi:hypothetical protein
VALNKLSLTLFLGIFIFVSNPDCHATFPENKEDVDKLLNVLNTSFLNQDSTIVEDQLQRSRFNEETQAHSLNAASCIVEVVNDLVKKNKYLVALSVLPLVQAETPQAETLATNFYGTVLPMVIGASVLSVIIGPTVKDCIYRGYNKLMSSQFDKLHDFIDTTVIFRWPHESLRWGYFALLRGNRDIGDIPVIQSSSSSYWRSFYEQSTSQPYTVELRHAKRLLDFNPFIVKLIESIDRELTQDMGWARTELYQQPNGLFKGFSYQSGACNLHIRGLPHIGTFEGISPFAPPYTPITQANRYRAWKKFFAAYKNENIELLPPLISETLKKLVLFQARDERDTVDMLLQNNSNTLFFIYDRGLVIALQKAPFPSETINFPKRSLLAEQNYETIIQSSEPRQSHINRETRSSSSSSSYSESKDKGKRKGKPKRGRNRTNSSSAEESVV